ncbi:MAG: DUF3662 and FHA domain-containing protein [Actinomycetota bacterium]|nr:DUF3662 and FHA domain-containing protein [Actinomycetota bacterium]
MGILSRFEKRLEKIFEGPFTKAFKGGVHPLEIARRLMREIDYGKALGVKETLAPNRYDIHLSLSDYERLSGYLDSLTSEMESLVITYANEKDYRLLTRPRLRFEPDDALVEGDFSLLASLEDPAGDQPLTERLGMGRMLPEEENRLGVLTILKGDKAGHSYYLNEDRTAVGRSDENDVVLVDPRASRFHAEIERATQGYVVRDLGSTNGTMVRGRHVKERLLQDGDTLVMGETEMRFGLITDTRAR